ncbi:hypothetical protein Daesc_003524 [Daldinia eschscholtzii]|uniref:Uncharacterized protein n=1 Tax=Daldinia eschscholtzii TaxID=292717 RepID=A0AAX6MTD2_9PEZI
MANDATSVWGWIQQNPLKAIAYGTAGVAIAAPAVIAGPALAAAGFGASGIIGGSIAAGAQSAIGNVAAGSLFATLQSAGMAGYGAAAVNGVIQAGGIFAAVTTALASKSPDRRKLNPLEYMRDFLSDDHSDIDNCLQFRGMLKSDVIEVEEDAWDDIELEKLIEVMETTPQLISCLQKIKKSMINY